MIYSELLQLALIDLADASVDTLIRAGDPIHLAGTATIYDDDDVAYSRNAYSASYNDLKESLTTEFNDHLTELARLSVGAIRTRVVKPSGTLSNLNIYSFAYADYKTYLKESLDPSA